MNAHGPVRVSVEADMRAYDDLPKPLRDFAKSAIQPWACVPMLRRAKKCGRGGRWNLDRLLKSYQIEDTLQETP